MNRNRVPNATYRLQFNCDFTFAQAAEIVPYLHTLGISHIYASPYLKARSGSLHGYDIVDHNTLNPEIGGQDSFEGLIKRLRQHGMGQILDVVPNHMGVGGSDNRWWLDVLENGQASAYAVYFDIDWWPLKEELRGKVLLPFLGAHYGSVLDNGELKLEFDADRGEFSVYYHEHRFPIDPASYPQIMIYHLDRVADTPRNADSPRAELRRLIDAFGHLPSRWFTEPHKRLTREHDKQACKQWLAKLYAKSPIIAAHIHRCLEAFNGVAGLPESFDPLHQLLESQAYRLAYWEVAADEINYRRFFDINDLAGLRIEHEQVFDATHRLILALAAEGKVDGLRIDHPDGLHDPMKYLSDLHRRLTSASSPAEAKDRRDYIVVEKILASYEHLPENWPVDGTTGYDYAHVANGILVYPESERKLDRLYTRFIGHRTDFGEVLYRCRKLIIRTQLSSGLTVLANRINAIAQANRHTRDFTLNGLRDVLTEVVACFPVYRTYITPGEITESDREHVLWAVAQAKKRSPATDTSTFDFIRDVLLLEGLDNEPPAPRAHTVEFVMRFQQYTSPVMAKAMEDTAFYIYNRLVSLNEVGGNPHSFGLSLAAFHDTNQERAQRWPHAMITTSTHDSKRSEDVRARINVLSEVSDEWGEHLSRWSRINRTRKRKLDGQLAPSRNDEYLLYQTLIGAWPLEPMDASGRDAFRRRIEEYMLKALREAKVHTSWINPNSGYEEATLHFIRPVLGNPATNKFLHDFIPFQRRIAWFGMFNSLSQVLLKLTSPGVADIYQGNELWTFSLVDPDNRRPVDYAQRWAILNKLKRLSESRRAVAPKVRQLLDTLQDGSAKLYLTWKALSLRAQYPMLFAQGDYSPLGAVGARADHVCAFARRHGAMFVVSVAPRWFALLSGEHDGLPLGSEVWNDTLIELPNDIARGTCTNVLTEESVKIVHGNGGCFVAADQLFANFPVALLRTEALPATTL